MDNIPSQITAELREKFDRHPVWVWYDSQEKYTGIIDEVADALREDGVNAAKYDGSFIELKHRLWKEDSDIDEKWLFYIPTSKNDAEWFRDIHKLGKQYRTGTDVSDEPVSQYLVEHESEIPEEFDDWGRNPDHRSKAFFCVLFGTREDDPREWVVSYLAAPDDYRETIEEYAQEDAWTQTLDERFGITAGLNADEIASQILFGEVHGRAPTGRYAELAADDEYEAQRLCEHWQRYDAPTYLEYARQIESEHDIEQAVLDSGDLGWRATAFRGIDEGLVRLCLRRLNDADFADLPSVAGELTRVVNRRQDGFWYQEDYADYWDILDYAVDTIRDAGESVATLEDEAFSPSELVTRYADNWWSIDANYRRYIQASAEKAPAIPGFGELKERVTRHYMEFLKAANRPLADQLADSSVLGTPQTSFFDDYASREEGTAIIICDGFRYELAQELRERVAHDYEHDVSEVSAALPSITEVGMAAHLPGELGLTVSNDTFTVTVDDERIATKADRVARFESAGFMVDDLSDVLDTPMTTLQEEDSVPRVVYSGIIDKLGENLDDDEALARAAGHVTQVEHAIQRLRQVGYERFVITADHGFLYTERLSDDLKLDAPDAAPIVKRRFAAADADAPLVDTGEYIELKGEMLDQVGIDAPDLRLLFPRSVACFRAVGGNMRYFHGGISLQELIVPCLTVTTGVIDEEEAVSYEVRFPDAVTNNIVTIEIEARSEQLSFDRNPTLELRATVDGDDVADPTSVEIGAGTNSARIRLKTGALGDADAVTFEVVEQDTRETIDRHRAKIDMVIRDDMGFDV